MSKDKVIWELKKSQLDMKLKRVLKSYLFKTGQHIFSSKNLRWNGGIKR